MPKPLQRKPSAQRRLEIAAAVLDLIGRRGASSLRTATIAEAVGMTSGALFRHFASNDAMLEAAVDLAIGMARDCFPAPELPPLERLQGLLLARVATIRAHPGLAWLLLSDQALLTVPPPAIAALRDLVEDSRSFLLAAIGEAVERGELRRDVAPGTMLVFFTGAVRTLTANCGVHGSPGKSPPNQPVPAEVMDTLCHLLGADASLQPSTQSKRTS